jgi:hypothetical protein
MNKHLNDSYTLRLPAELKAKVAESAKSQNRSLNADIVARLEKSFNEDSNKIMLLEEESIEAMQNMVGKIISNAVSSLLKQGVDTTTIQNAFNIKD